jgi:hypothetical protein
MKDFLIFFLNKKKKKPTFLFFFFLKKKNVQKVFKKWAHGHVCEIAIDNKKDQKHQDNVN